MTTIQGATNNPYSAAESAGSSQGNTAMIVLQTGQDLAKIASSRANEEQKIQATQERIGLAVADYYTGGLASMFYGWASKQWGGTMQKIRDFDAKYNPMTRLLTSLFNTDKWKTEGDRMQKVLESGVAIPEELQGSINLTRGRYIEELVDASVAPNFVGTKEDGTWVNNTFALIRDEKSLKAEDIWGYATFFEKFGNDWLDTFDETQRRSIANKALTLGLVREHQGTIDIAWNTEIDQLVQSFAKK